MRGPLLILAGAGTGKTRTLTHRVAHMVDSGIAAQNILAVTFTTKAAREMAQRVAALLPPAVKASGQSPTVCTFHSLCVRILRRHIERLGYKRNFVIYSESEQLGVVRKVLSAISGHGAKVDPREVHSLLSRIKNGGSPELLSGAGNAAELAAHIRRRYDGALHAANAVDFDDLLVLVLRLFREFPESLGECRERHQWVMVDEYQDTNRAQFELVQALASQHRNLCAVGDDDQSIYGWRGAEVSNLLDFEQYFPEARVIKLEENYRSTTAILEAANAVIARNVRRRPKRLWSRNGTGEKLRLQAFENEEVEARSVVEEIEFRRQARRIPWRDHAILFRTNIQSRPLETALRAADVRYRLVGGQSFFDRREIRDFLAYLKTFLNPNDDASLLRIANVPARGLSEATMERLLAASQAANCSVWRAMEQEAVRAQLPARAGAAVEEFVKLIVRHRAALEAPSVSLSQWSKAWLAEIDYAGELRRGEKEAEAGENRVRNLHDLVATLDGPDSAPMDRLLKFLEDLTLDADRESEEEPAGDVVTLITTHSCKGLEYPHVFVVGVEEGLLPHSRAKAEGTLDEERRLFYVALTRAMKTLVVTHCLSRKKYGQLTPCHPSSFLQDLPAQWVEDWNQKGAEPVAVDAGKGLFAAMRESLG